MIKLHLHFQENFKRYLTSFFVLQFVLSLIFFRVSFGTNDDFEIRQILNGSRFQYPDYHIPWMNSALSYSMYRLYSWEFPIPWYEILLISGASLACIIFFRLTYPILILKKSIENIVFFIFFYVYFFLVNNSISFSNSTVLLSGSGVVVYSYLTDNSKTRQSGKYVLYLFSLFLITFSFLLKPVVAVGVIVFLLPTIIAKTSNVNWKSNLVFIFSTITTYFLLKLINELCIIRRWWSWRSLQFN